MNETKIRKSANLWILLSYGVLIITSVYLLITWKKVPPEIPWFHSLPWGEGQLMSKSGLPIILGASVVLLYLGGILSQWTKKDDKIIEQTVTVSLTFIFLMLVINIIKVLYIFI